MLRKLHCPSQWWLFLRVFLFAAAVPLMFRLKLSLLSRLLERRLCSARRTGIDPATRDQIIACVEITRTVGAPLIRPRCLTRAVTLYYFLRRAGMDLALCFGAALKEGRPVPAIGHCWLAQGGEPYLELQDPRPNFALIYRWPEDPKLGTKA